MRISPEAPIPDWDSFQSALESPDLELRFYFDVVTGEVHVTGPFEDEPGEQERIDGDPLRYRAIDRVDGAEELAWMERFAADADARARPALLDALVRSRPSRRFRAVLQHWRAEQERWYEFREAMIHAAIEQWFAERALPVGAPPPWQRGGVAAEAHVG